MSREENNRYLRNATKDQLRKLPLLGRLGSHPFLKLLLLWAALLALYGGFYVFFSNPTHPGRSQPTPSSTLQPEWVPTLIAIFTLVFPVLGASLLWRQLQARKARRKEAEALLQPGPEAYLRLTDELLPPTSPFPDVDLLRAQRHALARILYGQDAQARHELNQVNWRGKAPLLQAMERGMDALLHLLCKDDPERGLTLAREALAMADLNPAIPGAKTGRVFYDVLLHSAEVLTGTVTPEGTRTLEHHQEGSPLIVVRLLSAWALRVASVQGKDLDRAERMRQFLQTHAPHCAPLHRLPARAMADT
ncbi:hypothetical protein [Corallococcus exercitus]|uniref:Uncharacterized protein n=1 Tax=Corallococcus exercitus TaxID=2316736 RepID=A0A7Y4NES7_9BACT|nr:hypothetical protein [Corallococcus exercitus]NOK11828.1 hypothetical protein [Corallococcus exercitus]